MSMASANAVPSSTHKEDENDADNINQDNYSVERHSINNIDIIPQIVTTEPLLTRNRSTSSLSSMTTHSKEPNDETINRIVVPLKNLRQYSIQHGGVLNADSVTYLRFHRLRYLALWACGISFLFDIGLGLAAFINCITSESFIGFSYSVDTLMDSLCTGFVAWHLRTKSISDIHRRDRLACCVIGALFIGSFLAIESRAIQSMILAKVVRPNIIVFIYSLIHIIVFVILSIIKIYIGKQIKSHALMADALNSIIGLIMLFPLVFWDRAAFLGEFSHLDDLVQVLMGLFLFTTGWKLILDSITTMNVEYARNLCEEKLERILEKYSQINSDFGALDNNGKNLSIAPIAGTRRFSIISNRSNM